MTQQTGAQEFLVIALDDSRFALRAASVEAAVAPRVVTPLPFVPAYVEGLVNVNERVLPLLDLRALLAPGSVAPAQTELVVIETTRAPCALRVDRVVASVSVADGDLMQMVADSGVDAGLDADADKSAAAKNNAALAGEKNQSLVIGRFTLDGASVLVLDGDLLGQLVTAGELPEGRRGLLGRQQHAQRAESAATESCIVVICAGERYGIALAEAVEILDINVTTPVPGAPAAIEGVAIVRGDVLLVLSLAQLLRRADVGVNAARDDAQDKARNIVVIERAGAVYGLRVDAVEGILAYEPASLRKVDADDGELAGVLVDGQRAIGLLGGNRLLNAARCKQFAPFLPARRQNLDENQQRLQALLEVDVAGEGFAIPLAAVQRIARWSSSLRVENDMDGDGRSDGTGHDSSGVAGAVNLDGAVLPVIDLAARLALPVQAMTAAAAWVVVGAGGQQWAIAVNEARGIVDVPDNAIEALGEGRQQMIGAVARVDTRLITLLNINALLKTAQPVFGEV